MKREIRRKDTRPNGKKNALRFVLCGLCIYAFVFLFSAGVVLAETFLDSHAPYLSSASCWIDFTEGNYITTFVNVGGNAGELGYSQKLSPDAIHSLGIMASGESRTEHLTGGDIIYHWTKTADIWWFQGTFEIVDRGPDNQCKMLREQRVPVSPTPFAELPALADCQLPTEHMTRQYTLPTASTLYYAPDHDATTELQLEAGKTVWLMDEFEYGFNKVWFACQELWIER